MSAFSLVPERTRRDFATQVFARENPHFYSAIHVRRINLRDQIHGTPDQLAKRCKKFLSLNPEYADGANTKFWAMVNNTEQQLPWVISGTRITNNGRMESWSYSLRPRTKPCVPFESGPGVLPGMEKFTHREHYASYNK